MAYPHKWSPISYKSIAGQRGESPNFRQLADPKSTPWAPPFYILLLAVSQSSSKHCHVVDVGKSATRRRISGVISASVVNASSRRRRRLACVEGCVFGTSVVTRAAQPVATCRQSPYLHKPAIVIVTSFLLWRLAPTALAVTVLIMTSFSLWRHSLLSWPRPPLRTNVRYGHLTAFNI